MSDALNCFQLNFEEPKNQTATEKFKNRIVANRIKRKRSNTTKPVSSTKAVRNSSRRSKHTTE